MSGVVLDSSAVLAFLFQKPGKEHVEAVLGKSVISAVNLAEVFAVAQRRGGKLPEVSELISDLLIETRPFGGEDAYLTGSLWPLTKEKGLSLGDRCCLALGKRCGFPVFTADNAWQGLEEPAGVELVFIRSR